MYFNGPYLRVLTPKTTNGVIPDTTGGEVQYKESFLPLSAKKQLEKKNARLTKHGFKQLVAIIEVVGEDVKKVGPKPSQQAAQETVQSGEIDTPPVKQAKPNPKPRKEKPE